jgi:hypothetical protein
VKLQAAALQALPEIRSQSLVIGNVSYFNLIFGHLSTKSNVLKASCNHIGACIIALTDCLFPYSFSISLPDQKPEFLNLVLRHGRFRKSGASIHGRMATRERDGIVNHSPTESSFKCIAWRKDMV